MIKPDFRLQIHISQIQTHTHNVSVRFSVGWSDLEAVAAVLTLHGHDRTVVQIQNHPACHCAPRLTHQIPPLREEKQPVPRRSHQPRLTAGHTEFSMLNYKRHLLTWSNLTDEVIRTSWCWGNLLSGWGRDSRGLDRDPACRRCHPRTGALSETSAWPLLRPLAETQYWSTGRERERITDNPHMCSETKTAPLPLIHAGNWAQKTVHLLRHQLHPLLKEIYLWKTNQDRRLFSYIDYNAHKQHLNWRKTSWEVTL